MLLPAVLAGLIAAAVVPVVLLSYFVSSESAARLVGNQGELVLDGIEAELRSQLEPVEAQLTLARDAVAKGQVNVRDAEQLRVFVLGLLAATPQAYGIGLIRNDGTMRRWERGSLRAFEEPASALRIGNQVLAEVQAGEAVGWTAPFVSQVLDDAIVTYRAGLEFEGEPLGVLAVGVRAAEIAGYLDEVSERFGVTAFVLAGRDRVFAYPGRRAVDDALRETLPNVVEASDPIVRAMWADPRPVSQTVVRRSESHWTWVGDEAYAYVYRDVEGFGPEPLVAVAAIPSATTTWDRWAPLATAGLGLLLALLVMGLAWWLGRRLSRPVEALDGALSAVETLDFERATLPETKRSQVREWRSMAGRIERTAQTLSRFQVYLPNAITRRLLQQGAEAATPQEHEATVMFVDLEGFTAFAAGRDAAGVGAFLSDLFARIGPLVEAEGGVIDKYTGDGLLAFWGPPDGQADHAERALRSALAIRAARLDADPESPRLRIGIHTGRVIVGDLGFPGRVDYTLVGETVNRAQRVEDALRGVRPTDRVVVGISTATHQALAASLMAAPSMGAPAMSVEPIDGADVMLLTFDTASDTVSDDTSDAA